MTINGQAAEGAPAGDTPAVSVSDWLKKVLEIAGLLITVAGFFGLTSLPVPRSAIVLVPWGIAVLLALRLPRLVPQGRLALITVVGSLCLIASVAVHISEDSGHVTDADAVRWLQDGLDRPSAGTIGPCLNVKGKGPIPNDSQVWVTNLNATSDGQEAEADTTKGFLNWRAAHRVPGTERDWETGRFGIGSADDAGKRFYVYVYVVPKSSTVGMDDASHANRSELPAGAVEIGRFPVTRSPARGACS
ncbi:hypothetical protein ACIP98_20970 [Streptomyces sp. NPDC088354]|uniref:hypothetical protein n=1 Tax=Streptomyces sp. NPDC088354 TaxID=3365856 RepID=UPI00380A6DF4